jgi:hypothetical protein
MPIFYILINSDLSGEKEIQAELQKVIKDEFDFITCYGVYDAVVKIKSKNEDQKSLQEKFKAITKVQSIMILTVC